MNGGFEQRSANPTITTQIELACGWARALNTPDYFTTTASTGLAIPCISNWGNQTSNNTGTAYAGFGTVFSPNATLPFSYEVLKTKLKLPLTANTSYTLKFDLSLPEGASAFVIPIQAFLSSTNLQQPAAGSGISLLPISTTDPMLFAQATPTTNTNGWDTVTFNVNSTTGGEEYLYIGRLTAALPTANTPAVNTTGCNYTIQNGPTIPYQLNYYFIDNVSLVPISNAVFTLPPTIACPTINLPSLTNYLSNVVTNGSFSGPGVVNAGGIYSFNPATAGAGIKTIIYTYTDSANCVVTLSSTINVTTPAVVPTFNFNTYVCSGGVAPILPLQSSNSIPITGTWSPATVSNTATGTYTFTPTAGQCAVAVKVVVVLFSPTSLGAGPNSYTFNYFTADYTTPSTILFNDTQNGVSILTSANAPNVTIVQVGNIPSGIIINPNGTVTILANTPGGTYNLQYQLTGPCGAVSNTTTLTINIGQAPFLCPTKFQFDTICYKSSTQNTLNSFFAPSNWGDGMGVRVNGVVTSSFTVVPASTLPAGIIINPNGTLNVSGGLQPGSFRFFVKITASTGNITVRVDFVIRPSLSILNDTVTYNTFGQLCNGCLPYNNVLANDQVQLCPTVNNISYLPATTSNVTLSQLPPFNSYFNILANGNINPLILNGIPVPASGYYTLNYKICDNSINPTDCVVAQVYVYVVSTFKMGATYSNGQVDKELQTIIVAPNPSDGNFIVIFSNELKIDTTIEVYNLLGQKVYLTTINNGKEKELQLNYLSNGTYILKVIYGDVITNLKINIKSIASKTI